MRCMIPLEIMEIPLQFHFFLFELRRKRLTSRRITSYKKYRALPTPVHRVTTLAYVIIRCRVTLFFFIKLEFWVRGLISKTMGNDTYCGKNWICYIWLHVVLIRFEFDSVISTNSLGHELAKSDLKGCLAKLLFEGLWDLFKSLYWNVTFEHSTWHWFTSITFTLRQRITGLDENKKNPSKMTKNVPIFNCRNLILKRHKDYLICRTCFVLQMTWFRFVGIG